MDSRRVGLVVVVALIVLALVGAGVQGVMHQQWMQGFAVGQLAASQGAVVAGANAAGANPAGAMAAPFVYGGPGRFNPFSIFFRILVFVLLLKIAFRIMRRIAWRHHMMQQGGAQPAFWGQPGNPQPWAQGQMPPWAHPGAWAGRGHWGWHQPMPPPQAPSAAQGQPQPGPDSAPSYGPQAPVDL